MRKVIFELCAESIQACLAAREGGADRIELCTALNDGGLTPSHGLIREAIRHSWLPVHVLLRPRGGDFFYNDDEFTIMREDLIHARILGASGFVVGILRADRTVDVDRVSELVGLAAPLEITFHRAFDHTASLDQALEDVIDAGCRRILTSGGERTAFAGADALARLVESASGRIEIAVGGLKPEQAASLALKTGARHFHASLRRSWPATALAYSSRAMRETEQPEGSGYAVDPDDIRNLIRALQVSTAYPTTGST